MCAAQLKIYEGIISWLEGKSRDMLEGLDIFSV